MSILIYGQWLFQQLLVMLMVHGEPKLPALQIRTSAYFVEIQERTESHCTGYTLYSQLNAKHDLFICSILN